MSQLLLCDGSWEFTTTWECSGAVTQAVYTVPTEYTAAMATEALFQGFSVAFPLLIVAWGGRQLIKMVR
jgi:hypothetical protein